MPNTTLTPAIALAHERLFPRVVALLKQVERSASRHPDQPVPAATRDMAKTLFAEARKILGREAGRIAGSATADLSALSLGLGQLLAALESFEAANSNFSARHKCTVWRLDGPPLPVRRLLPPGVEIAAGTVEPEKSSPLREELYRLIAARFVAGYDEGYRDAQQGKPPSSRYAETVWESLVEKAGGDEPARLRELQRRYGTTTPPPHLMPVGAKPGEWKRIEAERAAAEKAERLAKYGAFRQSQ